MGNYKDLKDRAGALLYTFRQRQGIKPLYRRMLQIQSEEDWKTEIILCILEIEKSNRQGDQFLAIYNKFRCRVRLYLDEQEYKYSHFPETSMEVLGSLEGEFLSYNTDEVSASKVVDFYEVTDFDTTMERFNINPIHKYRKMLSALAPKKITQKDGRKFQPFCARTILEDFIKVFPSVINTLKVSESSSFYFRCNGVKYRVSNHQAKSDLMYKNYIDINPATYRDTCPEFISINFGYY